MFEMLLTQQVEVGRISMMEHFIIMQNAMITALSNNQVNPVVHNIINSGKSTLLDTTATVQQNVVGVLRDRYQRMRQSRPVPRAIGDGSFLLCGGGLPFRIR
jgi:hypothetical protein